MKEKIKTKIRKLRFKYKISILNENTLEETHSLRLSPLNAITLFVVLLLLVFAFYSVIILFTPIRNYLPGYSTEEMRDNYMRNALMADSLMEVVDRQNTYIARLRDVVTGDIDIQSRAALDSAVNDTATKGFMTRTEREESFLKEYENSEAIEDTSTPHNAYASMFFTPLKGVVGKKFNPQSGQYGINITAKPSSPVAAALSGIVISISYTIGDDYTVVMSNDNNFITVYSNLSDVLVSPNQKVYAGQPIAISQTASESSLHFELWQNNMPLNPEDFIIF